MDRKFLKGREGDAANAVLAAARYNLRRLLGWLKLLLSLFLGRFRGCLGRRPL